MKLFYFLFTIFFTHHSFADCRLSCNSRFNISGLEQECESDQITVSQRQLACSKLVQARIQVVACIQSCISSAENCMSQDGKWDVATNSCKKCPLRTNILSQELNGSIQYTCICQDKENSFVAVGASAEEVQNTCGLGQDETGLRDDPMCRGLSEEDLLVLREAGQCLIEEAPPAVAPETEAQRNEAQRQRLIQQCTSEAQAFESQCTTLSAEADPLSGLDLSTIEAVCRAIESSALSSAESSAQQVSSCVSRASQVVSQCPDNTGPGFGSLPISQNQTTIRNIEAEQAELSSKASSLQAGISQLRQQTESCAETFADDGDPSDYDPDGYVDYAGIAGAASQTAAQGLSALGNRSSGGASFGGDEFGGGEATQSSFVSTPQVTGSRNGRFSGGSNLDAEAFKTSVPSTVGAESSDLDPPSFGADGPNGNGVREQALNSTNENDPNANTQGARLGALAGGGVPLGDVGQQNQPHQSGKPKKQKAYRSSEQRNLVHGYKKVKATGSNASLAIKPSDFHRLGEFQVKKALDKAQKTFGKDKPLVFDGKKFVLDFLAMKETEAFQRKNARMAGYFGGQSRAPANHFVRLPIVINEKVDERVSVFKAHPDIMKLLFKREKTLNR